MATKHKWDKSISSVWPLKCIRCGVTGRVKAGTEGQMQYSRSGTGAWEKKIPCLRTAPPSSSSE